MANEARIEDYSVSWSNETQHPTQRLVREPRLPWYIISSRDLCSLKCNKRKQVNLNIITIPGKYAIDC